VITIGVLVMFVSVIFVSAVIVRAMGMVAASEWRASGRPRRMLATPHRPVPGGRQQSARISQ
jgi:hypothetical protein